MRKVSLFTIQEGDFKPPKSILKPISKTTTDESTKEQDEKNDISKENPSSIYGIVAATKFSKGIKGKSKELMIRRRKQGDWGEYELAHAWSPDDLNQDDGRSISPSSRMEREATRMEREATSASDFIVNMARPYVMKPVKQFQEYKVKAIIKEVLQENLENQTYEPNLCKDLTVTLCNQLKDRVKRLRYPRYKYICHAIIGDIIDQDLRFASQAVWDSSVDSYAVGEYKNFSIYAVGIVFAVYCE